MFFLLLIRLLNLKGGSTQVALISLQWEMLNFYWLTFSNNKDLKTITSVISRSVADVNASFTIEITWSNSNGVYDVFAMFLRPT